MLQKNNERLTTKLEYLYFYSDGGKRQRAGPTGRDSGRVRAPAEDNAALPGDDLGAWHRCHHAGTSRPAVARPRHRHHPTGPDPQLRRLQHARLLPSPRPHDRRTPSHQDQRALRRLHLLPFQLRSLRFHQTIPHNGKQRRHGGSVRPVRRVCLPGHGSTVSSPPRDKRQVVVADRTVLPKTEYTVDDAQANNDQPGRLKYYSC